MLNDISAESVSEGDVSQTAAGASGEEGSRPSIGSPRRLITPRIFVLLVGVVLVAGLVSLSMRQVLGFDASTQLGNSSTCGAWEIMTTPDLDWMQRDGVFRSVSAISNDAVWIVGNSEGSRSHPLLAHWDGSELTPISISYTKVFDIAFFRVMALASDNVWVLGNWRNADIKQDDRALLHWNGIEWNMLPNPKLPESIYTNVTVAPVTMNDIWSFGYYKRNGVSKSSIQHWDGTVWNPASQTSLNNITNDFGLVSVVSPNNIWASGITIDRDEPIIHWDGTRWNIKDNSGVTITTHYLLEIAADRSGGLWAVGDITRQNTGPIETLTAHWGEDGWHITTTPNIPKANWSSIRGVTVISNNDVWAVVSAWTPTDGTMVIHWDGVQWSEVPSPVVSESQTLYSVSATTNSDIWVVGEREGKPLIMRFVRCK